MYAGNVFNWDRTNLDEPENNSLTDMPTWSKKTRESFCQDDLLLIPFDRYGPDALAFDDAIGFCKALGGNMSMPKSRHEEKTKYYDAFIIDIPDFLVDRRFFWYPVTDRDGGPWTNVLTGESPPYTNWGTKEPNGGIAENCTVIIMHKKASSSGTHLWADYPCGMDIGFICEIMNNIRLELRGLCTESVFDKEYTGSKVANGRRAFQGKYDFQLQWDDEMQYWAIRSGNNPDVYAFYNHSSRYPLGRYIHIYYIYIHMRILIKKALV